MTKTMNSAVAAYIDATNARDAKAFLSAFCDDAVVDDIGREICGHDAIAAWAEREIFGVNVSLDVLDSRVSDDAATLNVKVDGTFDRTGLPDPLIMTHELALRDGKIARLACRLAG